MKGLWLKLWDKSSFSQIATGKVPLSEKFMKRICSLDENTNFVWLQSGEGEMFLSNNLNSEDGGVAVPKDAWEIIKQQAESLSARDKQIDELMEMLKEQIQENKKSMPAGKGMQALPLPYSGCREKCFQNT